MNAPWRLYRSSPGASAVLVGYFHGDCDSLLGATVTSSRSSVRIVLHEKVAGGGCDSAGRTTFVRVRLGAHLGFRTVEGACTKQEPLCTSLRGFHPVPGRRLRVVGPR